MTTSKYSVWSFLPVNLFEQFRRLANFYFLLVVMVQVVPDVTPFPIYTSVAPLVFILSVTAMKEAYEDYVSTSIRLRLAAVCADLIIRVCMCVIRCDVM